MLKPKNKKQQKHEVTSISLHPLTFEGAIAKLANGPKQKESPAEGSGSTKEHAHAPDAPEPQTSRGPKYSPDRP